MKLIITDLDNTLLKTNKNISDYTVSVFQKCRVRGIVIAFASARAENAMSRFIEAIKPDAIISNGGATIRVRDEIIYKNPMSIENTTTVIEMCRRFTDDKGLITAECDDGYFCNFVPHDPDHRAASVYTDFADFRKPSYKITAELEKEGWGREIVHACPACTVTDFSGENWRRFAAKNSDKQTAMKILAGHLKIQMNDITAFGDDYNDIPMLEMAGVSVAVSNAIEEVKAIVDYITDSNDNDGVAHFVERMIL